MKHELMVERINVLHDFQTTQESKASQASVWGAYALALIPLVLEILKMIPKGTL